MPHTQDVIRIKGCSLKVVIPFITSSLTQITDHATRIESEIETQVSLFCCSVVRVWLCMCLLPFSNENEKTSTVGCRRSCDMQFTSFCIIRQLRRREGNRSSRSGWEPRRRVPLFLRPTTAICYMWQVFWCLCLWRTLIFTLDSLSSPLLFDSTFSPSLSISRYSRWPLSCPYWLSNPTITTNTEVTTAKWWITN